MNCLELALVKDKFLIRGSRILHRFSRDTVEESDLHPVFLSISARGMWKGARGYVNAMQGGPAKFGQYATTTIP